MAIKNISDLAKVAGVDAEALKKAIESEEEVDLKISAQNKTFNPSVFEEDENFQSWKKNYGEEKFVAGRETMIKEARNDLGLEFEGKKMDNLLNAFKEKVISDAKIEPEQKVKELQTDNEKLRSQLSTKDEEIQNISNQFKSTKFNYEVNGQLQKIVGGLNSETVIPAADVMDLYRNKRKIQASEQGFPVVIDPSTGEPIKDDLRNPIKIEDDFKTFAMNYVKKPEGGRGEGDSPEVKNGTIESFNKKMESSGKHVGSQEYNQELQKAVQSGEIEL